MIYTGKRTPRRRLELSLETYRAVAAVRGAVLDQLTTWHDDGTPD